jgi:superfamily I DNA and/or RNA helicase
MLDVQYRMHPSISRFPSSEFYNFALRDGTVDSNGEPLLGLMPPMSSHLQNDSATGKKPSIVFLDHAGPESPKDRSRVNHMEAEIVVSVVVDLLSQNEVHCDSCIPLNVHSRKGLIAQNLRGEDIGIIAPYVGQVSLLKRMFEVDTNIKNRDSFEEKLGSHRMLQLKDIEIKTVDGFEGREKEVIIFSTVRNNAGGYIGFLADRRRLNVGLTRAKRGLFVVGSMSTLKMGKMSHWTTGDGQTFARVGKGAQAWRRYAEFLTQEKMVIQVDGHGKVSKPHPKLVPMEV